MRIIDLSSQKLAPYRLDQVCIVVTRSFTFMSYQPLSPNGNASPPWKRWVTTLAFAGFVATVLIVYAGATPRRPWEALSDAESLIAPRLYFYGFEFVVIGALAYYIIFMWKNTSDRHAQFLQWVFTPVFLLDLTTWVLWGYSEFIFASITTGVSLLFIIYGAKTYYDSCQRPFEHATICTINSVPAWSTYIGTTFALSTYLGALVFQLVILVNAAFSKAGNSSFVAGATGGSVAIIMTILFVNLIWIILYHDFHVSSFIWAVLIPTYHASLSTQSKYTNVTALLFGIYLGISIYAIIKRFVGTARKYYICPDVCIGNQGQSAAVSF